MINASIKETGLALTEIEKVWNRIPSPPWSNSLGDEGSNEELANNELVIFRLLLVLLTLIHTYNPLFLPILTFLLIELTCQNRKIIF